MQALAQSEDSRMRTLFEVEAMIAGGRWDYLRDDFPSIWIPRWPEQYALTIGYSGLFDTHTQANGVVTRLILPISKLNLQLSGYGGYRYYSGNAGADWGAFGGVRAEWGLHMGGLFFGVGGDRYPQPDGDLGHGVSIEAGVSFALPWSRIKN